jgi:hypothetical protein
MAGKFFSSVMIFLGLSSAPALARDLQVEVEVRHIGGMLTSGELESLLADGRLNIEAVYHPTRLIEGVTARRERTMPIGSRLFAISQSLNLAGAQVERQGRALRFKVPDIHPEHPDYYRLLAVSLRAPIAPGPGRPQPGLEIGLLYEPPRSGAHETAKFIRHGAFDLGLRLRYRWSDAQGAMVTDTTICRADVQSLGNGEYRFRPRHRVAGLFRSLAPTVQSDPPSRPPAGQRSMRMREPYPDSVAGWKLSRNHLVQLEIDGKLVERLSVYAEQSGAGRCRRTRGYEALFAGGQPVELQRNLSDYDCGPEEGVQSLSLEASWLDDGSLSRYLASSTQGSQAWDGFAASDSPECGGGGAVPPAGEVQAMVIELQRIREAFLRP